MHALYRGFSVSVKTTIDDRYIKITTESLQINQKQQITMKRLHMACFNVMLASKQMTSQYRA